MSRFYEGLKDDVKDDLYKKDKPNNLVEYMQRIIKIDDRNYIHCIKKHGQRLPVLK